LVLVFGIRHWGQEKVDFLADFSENEEAEKDRVCHDKKYNEIPYDTSYHLLGFFNRLLHRSGKNRFQNPRFSRRPGITSSLWF
jgi:hypothetical protein